jgi:hypothetical protein
LAEKQRLIEECNSESQRLVALIASLGEGVTAVETNVQQNNAMIREINFPELLEKVKKLRDETEGRVVELAGKMKKKVGQGELAALEATMVDRLDKFLLENERSKAEKQETKQALLFLERKVPLPPRRSTTSRMWSSIVRPTRTRTPCSVSRSGSAPHALKTSENTKARWGSTVRGPSSPASSSTPRRLADSATSTTSTRRPTGRVSTPKNSPSSVSVRRSTTARRTRPPRSRPPLAGRPSSTTTGRRRRGNP